MKIAKNVLGMSPPKIITTGNTGEHSEASVLSVSSVVNSLFKRDHVDFHQHVFRQTRDFDRRPSRRRRAEIFSVDFVHGGKLRHIFQKNGSSHHFSKPSSG